MNNLYISLLLALADEDKYYPMGESRQGLIIVNKTFDDKDLLREGAEEDRTYLKEIYEHLDVKYDKVEDNLKENEMFDTIDKFSKNIKLPCSVIFVSISTHGKENMGLMGVEGRYISVGEIVKCFEKKELLGIPKVFIIQACKGKITEEKRKSKRDNSHDESTIPTQYSTKLGDVLIAYSTSEGCVSYRNSEYGSWYIKELRDCILNAGCENMHFAEILTICTNRIIKYYSDTDETSEFTQTPSYSSTLRRFLKFEKGEKKSYFP